MMPLSHHYIILEALVANFAADARVRYSQAALAQNQVRDGQEFFIVG
jgi:hypothetical protein